MRVTRQRSAGAHRRWTDISIVLSTMVNPLNSTMLSVGLVTISTDFGVGLGATTLLVAVFYATGAVAQPVMGRLADTLGPSRVMRGGMVLALLVSIGAASAPGFVWLVLARAGLALGTSSAYPSALVMLRERRQGSADAPTGPIAGISIGAAISTMLGPPLAGALIALGGWQALFWFNVPLIATVLVLSWLTHPSDQARERQREDGRFDFPGVALFALAVAALYAMTVARGLLMAAAAVTLCLALGTLVTFERRQEHPFIDVRLLAQARRLRNVYVAYLGFTLIWYAFAIAVPIWLQAGYGLTASGAGFLMLPTAVASIVLAPLAARLTDHHGPRLTTAVGLGLLLASCLSIASYGQGTTVPQLVATGLAAGASGAFVNVGMQVRLFDAAPTHTTGAAAGLYQSSRYIGAILSTSLVAATLGDAEAGTTMAATGAAMIAICLVTITTDVLQRRGAAAAIG
jgi:MFS family permease